MDIIWGEKTFLFTAITGFAAAFFSGVALHSAAFFNSKSKNVSLEMIKVLDQVIMQINDDISFSSEDQMCKLHTHFNHV
jgi:hypothetical protein